MAVHFDSLPRASFNDVEFAWDHVSIKSSLRHHVHEYRHTPGGALEKQGRKLYTIRFSTYWSPRLALLSKRPYKGNYPEGLYAIRTMFEAEETHTLVVPTLGSISACIVDFEQTATPEKELDGERADIVFLEDQSSKFLTPSLLINLSAGGLSSSMTNMLDTADRLGVPTNIFDDIQAAVDSVLAIRDQADMYSQLAAAKVLALADILREADRTFSAFQDPVNHELLEALKVLWAQANELAGNVRENQASIQTTTTPARTMSLPEVSTFVYGRADKALDLLGLNEFPDPMAIPGGTSVRYIVESSPGIVTRDIL